MKIFKNLADLFSRKTTAPTQKETAPEQNCEKPIPSDDGPQDAPCTVHSLGKLEHPAFMPQPLLSFYVMYKALQNNSAACGDISLIKAVDLFHPETSAYICTVYAVNVEKGWFWAEVGSSDAYFSKPEAFIYRQADKFRIRMKKKDDKTDYVAVCEYKEEVRVTAIVEEVLTPPTDADQERFVKCKKLPCSLEDAAEFVESLG